MPCSKKSRPSSAGVFGAVAATAVSYFGIATETKDFEFGLGMMTWGVYEKEEDQVYGGGLS